MAAATSVNRKTVTRYRAWAMEQGLLTQSLLSTDPAQTSDG